MNPRSKANQRPNILLIMTDQQRGDCLGIEGHPVLLTPTLDELACRGARFTRAYSTCPSCIAARRSLLTGQFPSSHGMVGFRDGVEFEPPATLPGALSDAGYQTFMVGRTMHQFPRQKRYGYDQMVLCGDYGSFIGDGEELWGHGLTGNGWTARPWHLDERLHPSYQTVDEALRFFDRSRDPSCPFFLTVSFAAPHPPLSPPAFYMERYLRMELPAPVIGDWATPPAEGRRGFSVTSDRVDLRGEALRSCLAGYFGLINHVDDQICRLLQACGTDRNTGASQFDNTVMIFTSDHGEMLGDHYLFRKAYPYEGSARVPLLIRSTPHMGIDPGRVCDLPVCLEDIMPTVLDLAGVPIPSSVDGRSLLPVLQGHQVPWRDCLHGEHAEGCGPHQSNHYLTDGRHKFIWYSHTGREQFFNLIEDPCEEHDLARIPQYAGQVGQWRRRLSAELKDRPEGFSDGVQLLAGRSHVALIPGNIKNPMP